MQRDSSSFFEEKFTFWIAVILSSLIFGIAHTYSVGIMFSAFVTGIFACLLYKQTKSIIPAILLHILTNIIAFYIKRGITIPLFTLYHNYKLFC